MPPETFFFCFFVPLIIPLDSFQKELSEKYMVYTLKIIRSNTASKIVSILNEVFKISLFNVTLSAVIYHGSSKY